MGLKSNSMNQKIPQINLPPPRKTEVPVSVAARLLGVADRTVRKMCEDEILKSAHKPTGRERGQWRIDRAELAGG